MGQYIADIMACCDTDDQQDDTGDANHGAPQECEADRVRKVIGAHAHARHGRLLVDTFAADRVGAIVQAVDVVERLVALERGHVVHVVARVNHLARSCLAARDLEHVAAGSADLNGAAIREGGTLSQSASHIRDALEPQDEEKDGGSDKRHEDAQDDENGAGGLAGALHNRHRGRTTVTLEVLRSSLHRHTLHRHTLHGHTLHRSSRSVVTVLGPGCALIAGDTVGGIRHVRAFLKKTLLKHNNAAGRLNSAPTRLERSDNPRSYAVSCRGGKRQREPQRGRGSG